MAGMMSGPKATPTLGDKCTEVSQQLILAILTLRGFLQFPTLTPTLGLACPGVSVVNLFETRKEGVSIMALYCCMNVRTVYCRVRKTTVQNAKIKQITHQF